MEKISQRTKDDCVICALAMVMGPPYSYERVLQDSKKYRQTDDQGRFLAWWKDYLSDEGFETEHKSLSDPKSFSDLMSLPENSRAMLVFRMPHLKIGHIVAIDHCGVIDPQDHPAGYKSVADFLQIFRIRYFGLHSTIPNNYPIPSRRRDGFRSRDNAGGAHAPGSVAAFCQSVGF